MATPPVATPRQVVAAPTSLPKLRRLRSGCPAKMRGSRRSADCRGPPRCSPTSRRSRAEGRTPALDSWRKDPRASRAPLGPSEDERQCCLVDDEGVWARCADEVRDVGVAELAALV